MLSWSIGQALLPKRGDRSVGAHRHYDPATGRTLNCQLGYGAFLHIGEEFISVGWELSLPGPWNDDHHLRRSTRIPDSERYRPPWAHALSLVNTLRARTAPAPLVADLSDDADAGLLAHQLGRREQPFVLSVPPHLQVWLGKRAPFAESNTQQGPLPVSALRAPQHPGTPGFSVPVHLPTPTSGAPTERPYLLFTEGGTTNSPGSAWITNLPPRDLPEAMALAATAVGPGTAVSTMARCFGLLDFEGRSFPGWHHHMSLVSCAFAYARLAGSAR